MSVPEAHLWPLLIALAGCTGASSPCDRLAAGPTVRAVESTVCVGPPARVEVSQWEESIDGNMNTDQSHWPRCGQVLIGRLIDTDGDGVLNSADQPTVIFGSGTETVAQHPFAREPLWRGYGGSDCAGLALADLDGDGWPEVVVSTASEVAALSGQTGALRWLTAIEHQEPRPAFGSFPAVADLDGDGLPEIAVGRHILAHDGLILAVGTEGRGEPRIGASESGAGVLLPLIADVNGDGMPELLAGNAAYDVDGRTVWRSGWKDSANAVADFDGDGLPEVVAASGAYLSGFSHLGERVWGPITLRDPRGDADIRASAPAVGDLDGSGVPEIVVAADGNIWAFAWPGEFLWRVRVAENDSLDMSGPSLVDLNGDFAAEVVHGGWYLVIMDGKSGRRMQRHLPWPDADNSVRPVSVADLDGALGVSLVGMFDGGLTRVTVDASREHDWAPGLGTWSAHAFTGNNVDVAGRVPSRPIPHYLLGNTMRAAPVFPSARCFDVAVEVWTACWESCKTGRLQVGVVLVNNGDMDLPAGVAVSLVAGESVLVTAYSVEAVPAGWTGAPVSFDVPSTGLVDPVIRVDYDDHGAGAIVEADEENNVATVEADRCE